MIAYHDTEWGVPVHDDQIWFAFIVLDTFQAGLAWRTILHKREGFRMVFHDFDPERVARMSDAELDAAQQNSRIVRNRLKIHASRTNARAFLQLKEHHGSFDRFIWAFTDGRVVQNRWNSADAVPATSHLSDTVSTALKQNGFAFVGSTICYALLQAAGVVNDHLTSCFRHRELGGL